MDTNSLLNTGILLTLVGGLVIWMKGLPEKLIQQLKKRFVYSAQVYDSDELYFVLEKWTQKNYAKKYKTVEVGYNMYDSYIQPTFNSKLKFLQFKQSPNLFLIKYKKKNLLMSTLKEKLENVSDKRNLFSRSITISGFFAKQVIISLLEEITAEYNNSLIDETVNLHSYRFGNWECLGNRNVKPLSNVILKKETKEFLVDDLHKFENGREWYSITNIPYKRTYLLYGPPGTGKTSMALAIASELKRQVNILNLNCFSSDESLLSAFMYIRENSILLIEDIDVAFVKRENKDCTLSFSGILNCLDGAFSKDGLITIITTNHINKLDPALLRAGRTDVKIEMPNAGNNEIEEYFKNFYGKEVYIGEDEIYLPICLVQEKCIQNKENANKAITELKEIYEKHNTEISTIAQG